ncbi:hypothetical protein F2Q69_00016231 [Brassica cretica]|uniref:Uncharacterized protein n=1 Tax=Brassica cretica TaxID=69181 RepID=A0A8S9QUG2_BRACR|nr:hypothetical protein F2Q69_00016231 [Brassica cretica]
MRFQKQENNFDDDSSSDDPDSYSTHEPIIHNTDPVLDSHQLDNGTKTVSTEQPVKTRERKSKKDESKPKTVCAEENTKKEETVMETDEVGMFMKTLLDDLTASRASLMIWMNTELNGPSDQHVVSRPPPKKRAVAAGQEEKESEKQRKQGEICQEMIKTKEKGSEVVQNGGDQAQQLDYDVGKLDMFLRSGHEQGIVAQTEIENATAMNEKKSVVLAIEAPKLRQRQKKTREANTIKNRSETKKDDNFAIQLSSSPTLQSFPVGSSLFPSSSQGDSQEDNDMTRVLRFTTRRDNNDMFGGLQMNPTTYSQQRDNNNMFGELQMAVGAIPYSGIRFHESEVGNGNNSLSNYRTSSGR